MKNALHFGVNLDNRELLIVASYGLAALQEASQKSNAVLGEMQAEKAAIQWEHSYVVSDKTYCIYLADDEGFIHEHAEPSGFPATIVTEVRKMIDPTTAET